MKLALIFLKDTSTPLWRFEAAARSTGGSEDQGPVSSQGHSIGKMDGTKKAQPPRKKRSAWSLSEKLGSIFPRRVCICGREPGWMGGIPTEGPVLVGQSQTNLVWCRHQSRSDQLTANLSGASPSRAADVSPPKMGFLPLFCVF